MINAVVSDRGSRDRTELEHLVKDAVLRLRDDGIFFPPAVRDLPVWHLGALGSLHRRAI